MAYGTCAWLQQSIHLQSCFRGLPFSLLLGELLFHFRNHMIRSHYISSSHTRLIRLRANRSSFSVQCSFK